MRIKPSSLLVCFLLVSCNPNDSIPEPGGGDSLPTSTGSYLGGYTVPTTAALANAAIYPVDHVEWTVAAGVATLHYDLPVGLVGGPLSITLSGPLSPGDTATTVASADGTGQCTAEGTTVTCREQFADLGDLPISVAVVEQVAAAEYAGPVADRVAVALQFDSDPITCAGIRSQGR